MLMLQVGGPKYATSDMICAKQQVEMMLDKAPGSRNVNKFVVGCKSEATSFYDVPHSSGHPNGRDGHPTLAGNVLMGLRYGIGLFYLVVRRDHYWLPFPYEVYFKGNRFLIAAP